MRSAVAGSKRSASYSSEPASPAGLVEQRQHQVVAGVAVIGVDRLEADAGERRARQPGASSTWTSAWMSGWRLVSRGGWIASTSLPNGRS